MARASRASREKKGGGGGRKPIIIVGLGLVVAVLVALVGWASLRARYPLLARQESSPHASTERQTTGMGVPASQKEAVPEEKEATGTQGEPKSRAKRADGSEFPFTSASWVMEQQRIGVDGLVKENSVSKVWIKGDRKRVETFRTAAAWSGTSLQPSTVVFADKDYEYAYSPTSKRLLKFPRSLGMEALSHKMTKKRSEERIGTEAVDGKTCETYRLINEVNVAGLARVKMEVKEYRWKGLVLKEVSKTIASKGGDTLVTQLKDVQLDIDIPEEKFVLPTDARIEEVKAPSEGALRQTFR